MGDVQSSPSGLTGVKRVVVSVDAGNLAAQTGAYQAFTVAGAKPGQGVVLNPSADLLAGYTIGDYYVSALNTVRVQFINVTAGALNPAAQDMAFFLLGT